MWRWPGVEGVWVGVVVLIAEMAVQAGYYVVLRGPVWTRRDLSPTPFERAVNI